MIVNLFCSSATGLAQPTLPANPCDLMVSEGIYDCGFWMGLHWRDVQIFAGMALGGRDWLKRCELSQVMRSASGTFETSCLVVLSAPRTSKQTHGAIARNNGLETIMVFGDNNGNGYGKTDRGDCCTNTSSSHLPHFLPLLCIHSQIPHQSSQPFASKSTSTFMHVYLCVKMCGIPFASSLHP